jgi:hypothetical protein
MSKRIRFHLDENVNPAMSTTGYTYALALRRYGIDITTTNDI